MRPPACVLAAALVPLLATPACSRFEPAGEDAAAGTPPPFADVSFDPFDGGGSGAGDATRDDAGATDDDTTTIPEDSRPIHVDAITDSNTDSRTPSDVPDTADTAGARDASETSDMGPLPCPPCPADTPCASYSCDPSTGGCLADAVPAGGECDDGDPCTVLTTCDASGACGGGFPSSVDCPCEADADCAHLDDDDLCNGSFVCDPSADGGACVIGPGTAVVCEAALPCETSTCLPATGECVHEVVPDCCGNAVAEGPELCDGGSGCEADCTLVACDDLAIDVSGGPVLFPGEGLLEGEGAWTIELFVRPLPGGAGGVLVGGESWRLTLGSSASGDRGAALGYEEGPDTLDGPLLDAGVWQHVALVRTAAGGAVHAGFYVGGLPAGDSLVPTATPLSGLGGIGIGAPEPAAAPTAAEVDELRISNVARYDAAFAPPEAPFAADPETAALYHFDHTAPGVAIDASGHGRHGVWAGAVSAEPGDPFGPGSAACEVTPCLRNALAFEPISGGAAVAGDASALDAYDTFTIELFLRAGALSPARTVVSRSAGPAGLPDWHVRLVPSGAEGRLEWVEGTGSGDAAVSSPASIEVGTWHHVAVVREAGGSSPPTVRWFVDGVASPAKEIAGGGPMDTTAALAIGSDPGAGAPFAGAVDELRITAGVVYTGDFAVPSSLEPSSATLALYRFDLGLGPLAWGEPPGLLPPLVLEGASFTPDVAPALEPCP